MHNIIRIYENHLTGVVTDVNELVQPACMHALENGAQCGVQMEWYQEYASKESSVCESRTS